MPNLSDMQSRVFAETQKLRSKLHGIDERNRCRVARNIDLLENAVRENIEDIRKYNGYGPRPEDLSYTASFYLRNLRDISRAVKSAEHFDITSACSHIEDIISSFHVAPRPPVYSYNSADGF